MIASALQNQKDSKQQKIAIEFALDMLEKKIVAP